LQFQVDAVEAIESGPGGRGPALEEEAAAEEPKAQTPVLEPHCPSQTSRSFHCQRQRLYVGHYISRPRKICIWRLATREKRISIESGVAGTKTGYRVWHPFRSKLAAGIGRYFHKTWRQSLMISWCCKWEGRVSAVLLILLDLSRLCC